MKVENELEIVALKLKISFRYSLKFPIVRLNELRLAKELDMTAT